MGQRSIIYVDGFNLYYGTVRGTQYKWLDIQRMLERLRPDDDIQTIHYFTALMRPPQDIDQQTYLAALATCPKVNIVLGKFKDRRFKCRVRTCAHLGDKHYMGREEKRTDVNIAVQMLDDAYQDRADRFVVVSGDSDFVPAVDRVKTRFPDKVVVVYVPSRNPIRGAAVELRGSADRHRTLPLALIKKCPFPATIPDGKGGTIHKPTTW